MNKMKCWKVGVILMTQKSVCENSCSILMVYKGAYRFSREACVYLMVYLCVLENWL